MTIPRWPTGRDGRRPHTKHSLQDHRRRLLRPAIIIIILYAHILFTQVRVRVTQRERDTDLIALHTQRRYYIWDWATILRYIILW